MPRGRPIAPVDLNDQDRDILQRWVRRPKSAQALALRARIILTVAEGSSNTTAAEQLGITIQTVGKWRKRFQDQGVDGLLDAPRPGAQRTITDQDVERVLTLTLESQPQAATHWSTRSMAQRCGLSESAVSRIWRAFALQPHRSETFKLSNDPLFIDKVRDIVGTVPESSRKGRDPVCRREVSDPGAGPQPAAVAHASRPDRAPHP